MPDYYVPPVSPKAVRARAAGPPDPFIDAPCPECGAEVGAACAPVPPRGPDAAAHPRRVDRAIRHRLDKSLRGATRA